MTSHRRGLGVTAVTGRTGTTAGLSHNLDKVFPRHFSFLWGELALYSFVVLVLTGIYLALFFEPSQAPTTYQGSYSPLRGVEVSEAYASVLHISFDVRAGLLIRQMHHWAALVFVASIVVHLGRVFFTGAFRRPREPNWVIGCTLLLLAIGLGFTGYSLPDDLLSGTGLRIADGVVLSIPLAGEWVSLLLFGGEWPSEIIVARLFPIHVFLLPSLLGALIGLHLALVWRQKHTQLPGPGRTERNVVGEQVWPGFALTSIGLLFLVAGSLAALGGLAQINPVWLYGPYRVADATADAQPDWYIGFLEGALRLMPPIEIRAFGRTVPNPFFGGVLLPGLMFTVLFAAPWIERRLTGDRSEHHILDRPRDAPERTAIGTAALTFVVVLFVAGAQDIVATTFGTSIESTRTALQLALLLGPSALGLVAWRLATGLGRRGPGMPTVDRVTITRTESGGYEAAPTVVTAADQEAAEPVEGVR